LSTISAGRLPPIPTAIVWHQGCALSLPPLPDAPDWQPASGAPQREQAEILDVLQGMRDIVAVTAARGRGKSAWRACC
jgi:tRNA(Met) cytidine acetyltransferase